MNTIVQDRLVQGKFIWWQLRDLLKSVKFISCGFQGWLPWSVTVYSWEDFELWRKFADENDIEFVDEVREYHGEFGMSLSVNIAGTGYSHQNEYNE